MRCNNCGNIVDESLNFCTECGAKLEKNMEKEKIEDTIELPELKDDIIQSDFTFTDSSIENTLEIPNNLEETTKIENDYFPDYTFTQEIQKQIDSINDKNELNNEVEVDEPVGKLNIEEEVIDTTTDTKEDKIIKASVKKRKRTLLMAFILLILIIGGSFYALTIINDNSGEATVDYETNLKNALDTFYKDNNTDSLQNILEEVKNDNTILPNLQNITNEMTTKYVNDFNADNINSEEEFTNSIKNMRETIKKLYNVSAQSKSSEIKLLDSNNYKTLSNNIDNIYNEAKTYLEALNYYKNESYNEAYYMFNKVESNNRYYNSARSFLNKIISEVMNILNNDINKIEKDINSLSEDEKIKRYSQIEDIIRKYNSIYNNLNLDKDTTYNNLLKKYQELTQGTVDNCSSDMNCVPGVQIGLSD